MALKVVRGRKGSTVEVETKKRRGGRRTPVRAHIKPKKATYVRAHTRYVPESVVHAEKLERRLPGEAVFWKRLHKRNNGVFFRGIYADEELDPLVETDGVLGRGLYVTWDEAAARAFAQMLPEQGSGKVSYFVEVMVPSSLKLLDFQSPEANAIKKEMGIGPFDKVGDRVFSGVFRGEVRSRGYDGVISDDRFDGLVVFDPSKVEVRRVRKL